MDIVIADYAGKDIAAIPQGVLELSYGENATEDTFTLTAPFTGSLYENCRVYVEGTGFGGLITGYKLSHSAAGDMVTYTGYSWQGLLARHIVDVPKGQDRYSCGKTINLTVMRLLKQCGLDDVFAFGGSPIEQANSAVNLSRYCNLYEGLNEYLAKGINTGLQKYSYEFLYDSGKIVISLVKARGLSVDERERVFYTLTRALIPVNHLVCLGRGKLQQREVIHLYVDQNQNISTTQYYKGFLENALVYDYSSIEEGAGKLEAAGKEKLKEYLSEDSVEVTLPENAEYNVGDTIRVTHPTLGVSVESPVTKKTARIRSGLLRVTYTVGKDATRKTSFVKKEYE